jgi:autotransporter-associated beta strand protein
LRIREDGCLGPVAASVALNGGTLQWRGTTSGALSANRTLSLSGTAATQNGIDANGLLFSIPGPITGAGGLAKVGSGTVVVGNPNNDYTGGTRILSGLMQFEHPGAIGGSGPNVLIAESGQATTGYPVDQAFLQRINPASTGVVALSEHSSANLDFDAAELTGALLGTLGTREYTGRLHPAAGVYRLGGTSGVLRLPNRGAVGGRASLRVGLGREPLGRVVLTNDNDLEGSIAVDGGVLEVEQAALSGAEIRVKPGATLQVSAATLRAARVTVDAGGTLRGCGTIEGDLVNNGTVEIGCGDLRVSGAITNNGRMSLLAGAVLRAEGTLINNGFLDLLVSSGTTLPVGFVNNGTLLLPGAVKIHAVSRTGTRFSMLIEAFPNHTYQLQRTSSLVGGTWQNVGPALSLPYGFELTLSDSAASGSSRFYRVEVR